MLGDQFNLEISNKEDLEELQKIPNDKFKSMSDEVLKKNNYANIWKWQEGTAYNSF